MDSRLNRQDDRLLLDEFHRHPERAFQRLMDGYRQKIFLFCLRAAPVREDAEDLAQEVFVRVWKGLAGFKGGSSLNTWIYRIAWNVCASHLERKGSAPSLVAYEENPPEDEPGGPEPSGADDPRYSEMETQQLVDQLFQKLPETHRLLLTLFYMEEKTYEEMAAVTGMPMGTVKATLHRARSGLRDAALREMNRTEKLEMVK